MSYTHTHTHVALRCYYLITSKFYQTLANITHYRIVSTNPRSCRSRNLSEYPNATATPARGINLRQRQYCDDDCDVNKACRASRTPGGHVTPRNIESRRRIRRIRMRGATRLRRPTWAEEEIVCACGTDRSFARERRAKPSQSPYLPEMIRSESAVSPDNRTIRAVDYARRNRLPFAYENPLCCGQVRRDYADVGEKVLHRGPRRTLRYDWDSGFAGRNTCTDVSALVARSHPRASEKPAPHVRFLSKNESDRLK